MRETNRQTKWERDRQTKKGESHGGKEINRQRGGGKKREKERDRLTDRKKRGGGGGIDRGERGRGGGLRSDVATLIQFLSRYQRNWKPQKCSLCFF